jgi:hypothetical protein
MYPVHGKCSPPVIPTETKNQSTFNIRGGDNSETINKIYIDKQ